MSEEFTILMTEGNQGLVQKLGNKQLARKYRKSLGVSDSNLLVEFLEQREVGERISVDSPKANDLGAPILTKDDNGIIRLQSYLTVLTNVQAGQKIFDKLDQKYPGFQSIPEATLRAMLKKFLEKYEKKLTDSTGNRAGKSISNNAELRKKINRSLKIFSDRTSGRTITTGMLDKVKEEKLVIDSDASKRDKELALQVFSEQDEEIKPKLEPFIELLEKVLRLDSGKESLTQPSDILQDLISKGDLRLTKNRTKIYEYWEKIDKKYENVSKSHSRVKSMLEKAFPKTEDIFDQELAKYVEEFNKYDAEDLKYVFQYPSVSLTTVDSKTKTLEILDAFLDKTKNKPDLGTKYTLGQGVESRSDTATGYRVSQEQGGGQVAEMEEVRDVYADERELIQTFAELIDTEVIGIDVDPLYAYAWKMGQSGFKVSPSAVNEMKGLMNRAKKTAIRLELNNNDIRELSKYIKDIDMKSVINEGDFYLPYQENLMETVPGYKEYDVDTEKIRMYLDNLSRFVSAGSDSERPLGRGISAGETVRGDPAKGKKFEVVQEGKGISLPSKGLFRTKLPALGQVDVEIEETTKDEDGNEQTKKTSYNLEKQFNELLDAVKEYFLEPATSDAKPLSKKFQWIETQTQSVLARERMNKNAFITMLGLQMNPEGTSGLLLDESDLRLLVRFLKRLSMNVSKQTVERFLDITEDAARAVDDAFEGNDVEGVNTEFGNLAYNILKKNSIDIDEIKFGIGTKKKLSEWHKQYENKSTDIFPFAALYYHITSNQTTYRALGGGFVDIIADIKLLEDKLDIVKSTQLERNFLEAHDNVRKMMNKPLYFGISSVDNYEDMQATLGMMKSKFKTDLTAMEVEGIVKELDSMQNLSRKYGISTEGVYYLKAIHR